MNEKNNLKYDFSDDIDNLTQKVWDDVFSPAVFHLEKRQKHGVITDVASIYARDDIGLWLRKREDKIIYFRQEKSRESTQQSQPIGRIDSLLGVGALQRLVANRSESSFSTGSRIRSSEDVVKFYIRQCIVRYKKS